MSQKNQVKTKFPRSDRRYEVSSDLLIRVEQLLKKHHQLTLRSSKEIANCIVKASNYYIENPKAPTLWTEKWFQIAYLTYYLPLNSVRLQAVVDQGLSLGFFNGLNSYLDFGSGLSSTPFLEPFGQFRSAFFFDRSSQALRLHEELVPSSQASLQWIHSSQQLKTKDLLVLSYVATELSEWPSLFDTFESILIVEPSTRDDGRALQDLRDRLLKRGYYAWAPCLHQKVCPLLAESKRDWCHDRVHLTPIEMFTEIESFLPMKNSTLTYSYLLLKKTPPPVCTTDFAGSVARAVGDLLEERGKYRQMVCRGEKREFISWLKKEHEKPVTQRGQTLVLPVGSEIKGDEIRISQGQKVNILE